MNWEVSPITLPKTLWVPVGSQPNVPHRRGRRLLHMLQALQPLVNALARAENFGTGSL